MGDAKAAFSKSLGWWAVALGLGFLGMALNALPVELVSGVHVLFGHLPVLVAALALGPFGGAVAGFIAGSVTVFTWGHPWAWVLFLAEGTAIGLLSRRYLPLPSLAIFWLVTAPGYVALLSLVYPFGIAAMVLLKYIFETSIFTLILQGALMIPSVRRSIRGWLPPPAQHIRVGTALRTLLALTATLPLLVLAATEARLLYHAYVQSIDLSNMRTAGWAAPAIDEILSEAQGELDNTARALEGVNERESMRSLLLDLLERGTGLHAAAIVNAQNQPTAVVGRLSFPDARTVASGIDGESFNVLEEASAQNRIAAARSLDDGRRLVGIIDLPTLVHRLELSADPEAKLLIIDDRGAVLADSWAVTGPIRPLDPFQQDAIREAGAQGQATYLKDGQKYRTLLPQNTVRLAVASIQSLKWRAVVERTQSSIQPELERALTGLGAGLVVALGVVMLAAIGLSRAVIVPVQAVSDAAARIQGGDRDARALETDEIPEEIQRLGHGFNLMAEEVGRKLDSAEAANREKDEFLSIASHELKSPLTTIKTQLQLLQRRVGPEEAVKLTALNQQIDKLARLIGQLLDASALGAGRLTLEPTAVDLEPLLRRVAEGLVGGASPIHQLQLCLEPVRGHWDEIRLEQVVYNLVANAVKYSPRGGPIEVSNHIDGDEVEIRVADRGIGIPPEKTEQLFGRFARGERDRGMAGMGVGLYVSREIVLGHGGRIWMEPREGGGTEVVFRLPLQPVRT